MLAEREASFHVASDECSSARVRAVRGPFFGEETRLRKTTTSAGFVLAHLPRCLAGTNADFKLLPSSSTRIHASGGGPSAKVRAIEKGWLRASEVHQ